MFRRPSSIGVLTVAVFGCSYLIAAVGAAFASQKFDSRRVLTFTDTFLAQSSRDAASRLRAKQAVDALQTPSMQKPMPMPLVVPLFLADSKFQSSLIVVNGTNVSTYADVAIRGVDGTLLAASRVGLAPHAQQQLDISATLLAANSTATAGSIVVMPSPEVSQGSVVAQLSITYLGSSQPNYIDEETAMPTAESSQVLRGVADSGYGSAFVAITNLSSSAQHVGINCLGEGHTAPTKQVALPPNGTFVGPACTADDSQTTLGDLDGPDSHSEQGHGGATGIALTSDSAPGSFAAFALQPHRTKDGQFFSSVPFSDPKMLLSPNWVFTGVPIGSADELPGSGYTPEVSLANFSSKGRRVTITYAVTSASSPSSQTVRTVLLPAATSKSISFRKLQGDPTIQNSFIVSSDGAPGDVLAKVASKSEDGIREVELRGKDQNDPKDGGSHPWSIENGSDSTLLLFNPTDRAQYFNVYVHSGSTTWQKAFHLQTMETKSVSIGALIRGQMKDDKGRVLPKDAQAGQVGWHVPHKNAGRGRVLQSNRASLMARSFSCGDQYEVCEATFYGYIVGVTVGQDDDFGEIDTMECENSCDGTPEDGSGFGLSYSWSSENTSIAQVDDGGDNQNVNLYGAGAGDTDAFGEAWDDWCDVSVLPPVPVGPYQIEPVQTEVAEQFTCPVGQGEYVAGYYRQVINQVQYADGTPYGQQVTAQDYITIGTPNDLYLNNTATTPSPTPTDSGGNFTDNYTVCSDQCPTSTGQTDALQSWWVNSLPLPHADSLVAKCTWISIDGH